MKKYCLKGNYIPRRQYFFLRRAANACSLRNKWGAKCAVLSLLLKKIFEKILSPTFGLSQLLWGNVFFAVQDLDQ